MCGDSWFINLGEYCVEAGDTLILVNTVWIQVITNLGEYCVDADDTLILVNTVWIQVIH